MRTTRYAKELAQRNRRAASYLAASNRRQDDQFAQAACIVAGAFILASFVFALIVLNG